MKRIAITGGRGYIGAALVEHLKKRSDLELHVFDSKISEKHRYQDVTFIHYYDTIIHLAAHSNVKACNDAPAAAWENNVTGFEGLLRKMRPSQRLIYASTAGVYHGAVPSDPAPMWTMRPKEDDPAALAALMEQLKCWNAPITVPHTMTVEYNPSGGASRETDILAPPYMLYDLTKRTMDDLARLSHLDCYGLRFGTLAGPSPVMRHDPVVNAMVRSAMTTNIIRVQNPHAPRAVLGIGDCVRAIEKVMEGGVAPGTYNVASFNTTIMDIAETVARLTGARIQLEPDTPHYEFKMDTSKGQRAMGIAYTDTLEGLCEALLQEVAHAQA